MEFRHPIAAAETNASYREYLTKGLNDPEGGYATFEEVVARLGNAVKNYPDWHPILTTPPNKSGRNFVSIGELDTYKGIDHTVFFVRGFVTCPYSEKVANKLVDSVNKITWLHADRLEAPLYSDSAFPVLVEAVEVELEADGTIRSRDALIWHTEEMLKFAHDAQVAETWWNLRTNILGSPHGSRSSLLVNQHTGGHMRKIVETLNNSGMYGPVKEWSLDMLSEKKRKTISETLVRTAVDNWKKGKDKFEFELRDEICKAEVRDTWDDGYELSVRVTIGDLDLSANGFYYPEKDKLQTLDPNGKRKLAEKFL
ncbi:hypothetical protein [Candidatus Vondammii sp. HM_W22]|uniref:hypothetical protein n=1 Tax=Candidatus Vondammii sp. HM_W22 TaxID=2687299 RepID=UPI002E7B4F95|nr:hypothetical protein [Candidatus Vondammii sp. HM_W22]